MRGYSWIDISVPVRSGMVRWPGDPPVRVDTRLSMDDGYDYNMSKISMPAHTATHIDAPAHFIRGGKGIDEMPADVMIGEARVILIKDAGSIKVDELVRQDIQRGERVLFKTRNSDYAWGSEKFVKDYIFVSEEAAAFLVEKRVRAVGIDYLSVGQFKAGTPVHRILLGAGVWLIEGLDLSKVKPGKYFMVCLPLRLIGCDGSPARAFLQPMPPAR